MKILVFKTNIANPADKGRVADALAPSKKILNWNVDFEGEHSLLVVGASGIKPDEIIERIREAGFECEEV